MSIEFVTGNISADDATFLLGADMEALFPTLIPYLNNKTEGVRCNGMSLKPMDTGGWCATLRLTFTGSGDSGKSGGVAGGDYVVYGFGVSLCVAIAALEARFLSGQVNLTPDRYGSGTSGKSATKGRK